MAALSGWPNSVRLTAPTILNPCRSPRGGSCDRPDNVGRCKQVFHRWFYGGSFGGPVIKDKFFFFGAFEQKREPGALSPATGVVDELNTFATQTSSFPGGPYAFPVNTLPFPYIDDLGTVKLDYKLSGKQSLFVRYGRQKWTNPTIRWATSVRPSAQTARSPTQI